jgi:cell division protein FtsL
MKRKIKRLKKNWLFVVWVGALFLFLLTIVFYQSRIIALRYEIAELEKKLLEEDMRRRGLEIEITSLRQPERIERLAKRYGFVRARPDQIVFLEEPELPKEKIPSSEKGLFAATIR